MPRLIFSQEWRDLLRHFSIFLKVENGNLLQVKIIKENGISEAVMGRTMNERRRICNESVLE